jgi:hypothetical protein
VAYSAGSGTRLIPTSPSHGSGPSANRTRAPNLNQAVGATHLETTPDPGGIILTPAGEKFAQEVPPVLAMLDRTSYDAVSAESVKSEETPGN